MHGQPSTSSAWKGILTSGFQWHFSQILPYPDLLSSTNSSYQLDLSAWIGAEIVAAGTCRGGPDRAPCQLSGSQEEVCLIHWEHWFPCESDFAPGLTCTGTSLTTPGCVSESHRMHRTVGAMGQRAPQSSTLKFVCPVVACNGKVKFPCCVSSSSSSFTSPTRRCVTSRTQESNFSSIQFWLPFVPQLLFVFSAALMLGDKKETSRKQNLKPCATLPNIFAPFAGRLEVHNVNLRKVATKLRATGGGPGDVEWGNLRRKVHLHCEGPASGRRVREKQQDTSRAIPATEPGPEAVPQFRRGLYTSAFTLQELESTPIVYTLHLLAAGGSNAGR